MAKVAAVVVSLILLGTVGWTAWQKYTSLFEPGVDAPASEVAANEEAREPTPNDFVTFIGGVDAHQHPNSQQVREEILITLAWAISLSFSMILLSFIATGAIFSVGFVAYIVSVAASMHLLLAAYPLPSVVETTLSKFKEGVGVGVGLVEYSALITSAALIAASLTILWRLPGLIKGHRHAMTAIIKCFAVTLLVMLMLFLVPVEENVYGGFGLIFVFLSLGALIVIGLTYSNYRYD